MPRPSALALAAPTLALVLLGGCGQAPRLELAVDAGAPDGGAPVGSTDAGLPVELAASGDLEAPSCEARIDARGLSELDEARRRYLDDLPEVLVHARVDPVLFLAWPDAAPRGDEAALMRVAIADAPRPIRALRSLIEAHRDNPAFLRDVLLSDGYLFAREPAFARALSAEARLEVLFEAPRVYRARDGVIELLTRDEDGRFVDAEGRRATLRLNDRVAVDEAILRAPLGLDLEVVRAQTGALRTRPTGIGPTTAAFELELSDGSRRASLVELREGRTEVVCVGGDLSTLQQSLAHARAFQARQARLRAAAREMVAQRVRFDEPINEPEGVQEDGRLRRAWRQAYFRGEDHYTYRGVDYPVFDGQGDARPPQVCIDFVFDAYNRALGSWYRGAREVPGRTVGELDLEDVGGLPRRSIGQLVDYAGGEDAVLARYDVPRAERVALREGPAYAEAVARFSDEVRPGDVLIVHGLREQDMRLHYHALLVLRTDPLTGVPMVVADNQGRPHLRSLASAMRAAPLRSIKHRLRPRF